MTENQIAQYFNDFAKDIYRYAYSRCNSQELAEDVTSEAFAALLNTDQKINDSEVKFWLMRVAKNKIIDRHRKDSKNYADLDSLSGSEFDVDAINYSESVIEQSLVELVQKELDNLDPDTKEVITLRLWDGMQFTQIAEVTESPVTTVKNRFYRGIEYIKNKMTREEKEDNRKVLAAIWAVAGLSPYQLPAHFNSPSLKLRRKHFNQSNNMENTSTPEAAKPQNTVQPTASTATGLSISNPLVIGTIVAFTALAALGGGYLLSQSTDPNDTNDTVISSSSSFSNSTSTEPSETSSSESSTSQANSSTVSSTTSGSITTLTEDNFEEFVEQFFVGDYTQKAKGTVTTSNNEELRLIYLTESSVASNYNYTRFEQALIANGWSITRDRDEGNFGGEGVGAIYTKDTQIEAAYSEGYIDFGYYCDEPQMTADWVMPIDCSNVNYDTFEGYISFSLRLN